MRTTNQTEELAVALGLGASFAFSASAQNTRWGEPANAPLMKIIPTNCVAAMTTLQRIATLALLALTLFGCADEQKPHPVSTTTTTVTTTTQTTRAVTLRIGMKGSEAIALAGIPCNPSTLKSIDEGANVTLNYGGHSYVFSKGVLQTVH